MTPDPAAQRTHVAITARAAGKPEIRWQMATWSPGDYRLANHAAFVRSVVATRADGASLQVEHPDPNTWSVACDPAETVTLRYAVLNSSPGKFSESVRLTRVGAFYNGPALLMYAEDRKTEQCTLRVDQPSGWQAAIVSLEPLAGDGGGQTTYLAPDFDTLSDSPILVGQRTTRQFELEGKRHVLAFFGNVDGLDLDAYATALRRIAAAQSAMFGGLPYPRYVLFVDVDGPGGGLEHLNSTRLGWGGGFPLQSFIALESHELVHVWNVKRLRPDCLGPFDYIHPPRTRNLWFAEGVTEYLSVLARRRAGLLTEAEMLSRLAGSIAQIYRTQARRTVTADESSLRVWEGGDSSGFGGLSYYLKGELIGLCLDLKLRQLSEGRSSLETFVRDMLSSYSLPKKGYPEDGIRQRLIRTGGSSMGPFYDLLCRSTEELPIDACLRAAGFRLQRTSASDRSIVDDTPPDAPQNPVREGWLAGP